MTGLKCRSALWWDFSTGTFGQMRSWLRPGHRASFWFLLPVAATAIPISFFYIWSWNLPSSVKLKEIVGVCWKSFHPAHRDLVLTLGFISFQMLRYGFFRQAFNFPPIFPFLLSCSWMNTPPINTEVGVPLVYFFPLPKVTPGETQQFLPAKLVVSFLSYPFSPVNWQSFSCRKSTSFATA